MSKQVKGITIKVNLDTKIAMADLNIVEKKADLLIAKLEKANLLKDQLNED